MGDVVALPGVHRARIRLLPIAALTIRLTKKARWWGYSETAAKDLVNGAFLKLIAAGAATWNPDKDPTAYRFLVHAMDQARDAERKRRGRQRTDSNTEAVEEAPPSSDPGADRYALEREAALWARGQLLAALANSPLALRVVQLCMDEGQLRPPELAERLGEPVARIYECQRRIQQEVQTIRAAAARREGQKP